MTKLSTMKKEADIMARRWLFLLMIVILSLSTILIVTLSNGTYTTNSIADYGNFQGNYDNSMPTEFICSFFPDGIEDYFLDTIYHYRAIKGDAYAFEAYLEFTIADPIVFRNYLESIVDPDSMTPFIYDSRFSGLSISDIYDIDISGSMPAIDQAQIGKILVNKTEQRIVFWALGVYDGGRTSTNDLDFFFTQYEISPVRYAEGLGDNIYS